MMGFPSVWGYPAWCHFKGNLQLCHHPLWMGSPCPLHPNARDLGLPPGWSACGVPQLHPIETGARGGARLCPPVPSLRSPLAAHGRF